MRRSLPRLALSLGLAIGAASVCLASTLVVNDFESGAESNALGGDYGAWNRFPDDHTQNCTTRLVEGGAFNQSAHALRVDYDVDSPNPAFNGFWTKLKELDLRPYQQVSFAIKGDAAAGYTTQVKVELKNGQEIGRYLLKGVTDQWQRVSIPLAQFDGIHDLSRVTEFVMVFDDMTSTTKTGAVYLDDIAFE